VDTTRDEMERKRIAKGEADATRDDAIMALEFEHSNYRGNRETGAMRSTGDCIAEQDRAGPCC
jgi:glucose-6-phosphate dehydrogenase assembly protein OpcA